MSASFFIADWKNHINLGKYYTRKENKQKVRPIWSYFFYKKIQEVSEMASVAKFKLNEAPRLLTHCSRTQKTPGSHIHQERTFYSDLLGSKERNCNGESVLCTGRIETKKYRCIYSGIALNRKRFVCFCIPKHFQDIRLYCRHFFCLIKHQF